MLAALSCVAGWLSYVLVEHISFARSATARSTEPADFRVVQLAPHALWPDYRPKQNLAV